MAWIIKTQEVDSDSGRERGEKSSVDKISRGIAYFWGVVALLMGVYYFFTYSFITGALLGFSGVIAFPRTRRFFEREAEKAVKKHEGKEVEAKMTRGFVVVFSIGIWLVGASTIPPS